MISCSAANWTGTAGAAAATMTTTTTTAATPVRLGHNHMAGCSSGDTADFPGHGQLEGTANAAPVAAAPFQWYGGGLGSHQAGTRELLASGSTLGGATSDHYTAPVGSHAVDDAPHGFRKVANAAAAAAAAAAASALNHPTHVSNVEFGHPATAQRHSMASAVDWLYARTPYAGRSGDALLESAPNGATSSLYSTTFDWLNASAYGKTGSGPVAAAAAAAADFEMLHKRSNYAHYQQYQNNGLLGANAGGVPSTGVFSSFPYGPMMTPLSLGVQASSFSQSQRPTEPMYPWMKYTGTISGQTKRTRHTYSRQQTLELEKEFYSSRYLTRKRRKEICQALRLTERQVKICNGPASGRPRPHATLGRGAQVVGPGTCRLASGISGLNGPKTTTDGDIGSPSSRRNSQADASMSPPSSDNGSVYGAASGTPGHCSGVSKNNTGGVAHATSTTPSSYYNIAAMAPQSLTADRYTRPPASYYHQHTLYPATPSRFASGGYSHFEANNASTSGYAQQMRPPFGNPSSLPAAASSSSTMMTSPSNPSSMTSTAPMTSSAAYGTSSFDDNVLSAAAYTMGMGQNPFYAGHHPLHQHHAFYAMMGQSAAAAAAGQQYFGAYPFMRMGQFGEKKRGRQTYSRWTTSHLEQEFKQSKYLNRSHRVKLSQFLQLTERQIKIWRMKHKKEMKNANKEESDCSESSKHVTVSSATVAKGQSVVVKTGHLNGNTTACSDAPHLLSTVTQSADESFSVMSRDLCTITQSQHGSASGTTIENAATVNGTAGSQSYYYPLNPYSYSYSAAYQNQLQQQNTKFDSYYLAVTSTTHHNTTPANKQTIDCDPLGQYNGCNH